MPKNIGISLAVLLLLILSTISYSDIFILPDASAQTDIVIRDSKATIPIDGDTTTISSAQTDIVIRDSKATISIDGDSTTINVSNNDDINDDEEGNEGELSIKR